MVILHMLGMPTNSLVMYTLDYAHGEAAGVVLPWSASTLAYDQFAVGPPGLLGFMRPNSHVELLLFT